MRADIDGSNLETQAFWDKNPCGLSATWEHSREVRYKVTDPYLRQYLTRDRFGGQTVLEVGCGQGFDACEIARYCDRYVGVDLSGQSVRIAKDSMERCQPTVSTSAFLVADAERLPFSDETFSRVYSVGVLHHTADFPAALREIHRLLHKNGELILMLYHSFTPLWVVLRTVRGLLRVPFLGQRIRKRALMSLRNAKPSDLDS